MSSVLFAFGVAMLIYITLQLIWLFSNMMVNGFYPKSLTTTEADYRKALRDYKREFGRDYVPTPRVKSEPVKPTVRKLPVRL